MMNTIRFAALTSLAAVMSLAPLAKADEWNKKTILTVKERIQVPQCCGPSIVLEPGIYTMQLLDSQSDRHIVQVYDKDNHLITTALAIPNYRLQPTGHSAFVFWEVPAGQPPAMRAWFYPGDNFGQEFVYPKNMSTQIAEVAKVAVPTATVATVEEYKTAPISTTDETGTPATLDTATYTPPAPEPTPAPEPAPVPVELPHTASAVPLIGLVGLLSMLAFFAVRPARIR
jgi:hypothetical protein